MTTIENDRIESSDCIQLCRQLLIIVVSLIPNRQFIVLLRVFACRMPASWLWIPRAAQSRFFIRITWIDVHITSRALDIDRLRGSIQYCKPWNIIVPLRDNTLLLLKCRQYVLAFGQMLSCGDIIKSITDGKLKIESNGLCVFQPGPRPTRSERRFCVCVVSVF